MRAPRGRILAGGGRVVREIRIARRRGAHTRGFRRVLRLAVPEFSTRAPLQRQILALWALGIRDEEFSGPSESFRPLRRRPYF